MKFGTRMVVRCAWCARVRLSGVWVRPPAAGGRLDQLTGSGICPDCFTPRAPMGTRYPHA
jgi:hypothetical protein